MDITGICFNEDRSVTFDTKVMEENAGYLFVWEGAECFVIQRGIGNLELFARKEGTSDSYKFIEFIKTKERKILFLQSILRRLMGRHI